MDNQAAVIDVSLSAPVRLAKAAQSLLDVLRRTKRTVAFAESCTAGLASSAFAENPGASQALWGSFVCYTPEAKVSMLGLDGRRLKAHGLVSRETARDMAGAALAKSGADMAAAVTGLAGPSGDGGPCPVGTVWAAAALRGGEARVKEFHFEGGRNEVRLQAAAALLEELLDILGINQYN
jgi:nicotinamide-nucleotide amidase